MRLLQVLSESLARTRDAQQFQVQAEVALLAACDVEAGAAPVAAPAPVAVAQPVAAPAPVAVTAHVPEPVAPSAAPAESLAPEADALRARWPDVVDHVKSRKPILGALLSSARPLSVDGAVLTVAFETEFNRKRAEIGANRQAIEAGVEHALGRPYRLKCTVNNAADGQPSLLEDPVINYAARTFGGQPRRVGEDAPQL